MPKTTVHQLYNQSGKNVTLMETADTVLNISIEDYVQVINKTFVNNVLEFTYTPPEDHEDDDLFFQTKITRDTSHTPNRYYGFVKLGSETIQIIVPSKMSYKLYLSDTIKVSETSTTLPTDFKFWKTLEVTIQMKQEDHSVGTSYTLDGKECDDIILYNDVLTYKSKDISEKIYVFSLDYSLTTDVLLGRYQKRGDKQDDKTKLYPSYWIKAEPEGHYKPVSDFTHSGLTLKELIELSPYELEVDDKDSTKSKMVDKASRECAVAFDTLVRYCMDDDLRSMFFNQHKPTLDAALQDILNHSIPGYAQTASDFYKKYSIAYLAHALETSSKDEALKKVDFKRVTNYIRDGVIQDANYITQSSLLYNYGYKRAVKRIVDYIQDSTNTSKTYWAEQLYLYYSQESVLTKIVQSLLVTDTTDKERSKTFMNSIMFKMNLLDPSQRFSQNLYEKIMVAMYNESSLEWMRQFVMNEEEVLKHPEDHQDEINTFAQMLEDTAKRMSDTLQQQLLEDLARIVRTNLQAGLELYIMAMRCNVDKSFLPENKSLTKFYDKWQPKSTIGKMIKEGLPKSFGRLAFGSLSVIANGFSMYFIMSAAGSFSSLQPAEKAMVIATLVFMGVDAISQTIARSVKLIKDYRRLKAAGQAMFESIEMVELNRSGPEHGESYRLMAKEGLQNTKSSFAKRFRENLKSIDGMMRVIGAIGIAVNIGFTVYSLIKAIQSGDPAAIGLNSALILTQVVEGITLVLSLGLQGSGAVANAVIGNIASVISLALIIAMLFQKQPTTIQAFVGDDRMAYYRFHDMNEIPTFNNFEQRMKEDDFSSVSQLVSPSHNKKLVLKPDGLTVVDVKDKTETHIVKFNNPSNVAVNMTFTLEKITAQTATDSTPLAIFKFDPAPQFTFKDLPLYLVLQDDGKIMVRNQDRTKIYPITSENFKPSPKN